MAGYNRVGANLIGGIHAGLAIRQQRRAEAAEDSATALAKEAREAKAAFAEKWQNTFNPRAKTPKPAGTAPAPAAPAAPAAAIPAPTRAEALNASVPGTPPAAAIPTAPAAPAPAAPAASPQEEYEFATRQDVFRLRAELFSHVVKYEGSVKEGIAAVKAFDEKLRNDGLNALKQSYAAFEAKDYKNAALFGQLAASYSPDGYAPEFKVMNGKLAMVPRSEKTGEMAGNPVEVTAGVYKKLMQDLTMSPKEQIEAEQKDRDLADKEKNTASQVGYREAVSRTGQHQAETARMRIPAENLRAQAAYGAAFGGGGSGGGSGGGDISESEKRLRAGDASIAAVKAFAEQGVKEQEQWLYKGQTMVPSPDPDKDGELVPMDNYSAVIDYLNTVTEGTGFAVTDKPSLIVDYYELSKAGYSHEQITKMVIDEIHNELGGMNDDAGVTPEQASEALQREYDAVYPSEQAAQ